MGFEKKIKASIRKNYRDLKTFSLGRYPGFVYGKKNNISGSTIPVFHFHDIKSESFEAKLVFLKENGYTTLDCSEWLRYYENENMENKKKVVLTFDDGLISLWHKVYPLLKRYDFKAVSFICPGLIPQNDELILNAQNRQLCCWEEIKEMHNSGYIDFQAHGLYHDLVFSSSKLYGFLSPGFSCHFFGKDETWMILQNGNDNSLTNLFPYRDVNTSKYFGMPVFEPLPRMATDKRFEISEKLGNHMCNFVLSNGCDKFFEIKDWYEILKKEFMKTRKNDSGEIISDKRYQDEIYKQLMKEKEIIEEKLPGKRVMHFCAPWFKVTDNALKTAGTCGFVTSFLGEDSYPSRFSQQCDKRIVKVPRMSGKYIFLLPGKGRKNLLHVFASRDKM